MKDINKYLVEELDKIPIWCTVLFDVFKSGKHLTKDIIIEMLDGLCIDGSNKRIQKFSQCLATEYPKEYLAYQPSDDDFLQKDKQQKIKDQIAQFITTYMI